MSDGAVAVWLILSFIYMIALFVFYHKIFVIYYFQLVNGIFKELGVCLVIGMFLSAATIYLWCVAVVIILIVGLAMTGKATTKKNKRVILIVFVILAIAAGYIGHAVKQEMDESYVSDYAMLDSCEIRS